MIRAALSQSLTQGTIFSCAIAEDYPKARPHGVVITARCDAANDKAPKYNYLPVVPFSAWLENDGARIIGGRALADAKGQLASVLKRVGILPEITNLLPYDQIYTELVEPACAGKSELRKIPEQFRAAQQKVVTADLALTEARYADICRDHPKVSASVIKELIEHKLPDAYLIPFVSLSDRSDPHVVLLREVRHLPRDIASALVSGIDEAIYQDMVKRDVRLDGFLNLQGEIAMPISRMMSPEIEHMMQRWSTLFARIGVAECPVDTEACLYEIADRVGNRL